MSKLQVYIGYDPREEEAFNVLEYSLKKHCPDVSTHAIRQPDLREKGVYTRELDKLGATEFSLTRFLVPYLNDYKDWALFIDCDMLFTDSVEKLFNLANPSCAVQVVKHNHQPMDDIKMDGCVQTRYPKKNWSSVMLFNCGHTRNRNLTPEVVSSVQPSFLHRFQWLDEKDVGEIPLEYNFLVEYYKPYPNDILPKNIHYTLGMPFMKGYEDCDYSEIWYKYQNEMKG